MYDDERCLISRRDNVLFMCFLRFWTTRGYGMDGHEFEMKEMMYI